MSNPFPSSNQVSYPLLKTYQKGETIVHQGDIFRGYILIKAGSIKTIRTHESGLKTLLSIKIQGEIIGEYLDLNSLKKHSYQAVALEDKTTVEIIPLTEEPSQKLLRVLENIQSELNQAREKLEWMVFFTAEERIRKTLLELGLKMGRKFGGETLLKIPLTHEELATLTGTARQTVTTVLSKLKTKNQISYSRGRILFRNLKNL